MRWHKIKTSVVHRNPWFRVRKDTVTRPDAKRGFYYVVDTLGPSVFVVALNGKEEIYLICLHRYPTWMDSWELPGGNSEGKGLLAGARRELKEETGLEAQRWLRIGSWQGLNGVCSEISHAFIACGLRQTGQDKRYEEGIRAVKTVTFRKAFDMIGNGQITDSHSIVAITKAALRLDYNIPKLKRSF